MNPANRPHRKRVRHDHDPGHCHELIRYWQEGPGYDRNLDGPATALTAIDDIHQNPVRRRLVGRSIDWQWPHASWHADYDPKLQLPKVQRLPAECLLQTAR
jgi:hypothetical protein